MRDCVGERGRRQSNGDGKGRGRGGGRGGGGGNLRRRRSLGHANDPAGRALQGGNRPAEGDQGLSRVLARRAERGDDAGRGVLIAVAVGVGVVAGEGEADQRRALLCSLLARVLFFFLLEPDRAQQVPCLQSPQRRVFPLDARDRDRGREQEELVARRRRREAREGGGLLLLRAVLAGRRSIGGGGDVCSRHLLPPAVYARFAAIASHQVHQPSQESAPVRGIGTWGSRGGGGKRRAGHTIKTDVIDWSCCSAGSSSTSSAHRLRLPPAPAGCDSGRVLFVRIHVSVAPSTRRRDHRKRERKES